MKIGKKIRQFRQVKEWTLADLAKHSGVALSSLSRIETGRMTGTLESHIQIARALGVRLPELYDNLDLSAGNLEVRRADAPADKLTPAKGGGTITLLAKSTPEKKLLPALISVKPKQSLSLSPGGTGSERFIYLLKGQVEVAMGEDRVGLKVGDSLCLQAAQKHTLTNLSTAPALALSAIAPPSV